MKKLAGKKMKFFYDVMMLKAFFYVYHLAQECHEEKEIFYSTERLMARNPSVRIITKHFAVIYEGDGAAVRISIIKVLLSILNEPNS